jgi:hypothetical protein
MSFASHQVLSNEVVGALREAHRVLQPAGTVHERRQSALYRLALWLVWRN